MAERGADDPLAQPASVRRDGLLIDEAALALVETKAIDGVNELVCESGSVQLPDDVIAPQLAQPRVDRLGKIDDEGADGESPRPDETGLAGDDGAEVSPQ